MASVYLIYLSATILLTVAAGQTLRRHGLTILGQYFPRHPDLAFSVNHLLVTGFYLVNFGAACLLLKAYRHDITTGAGVVEFLSLKYGMVLALLAVTWFANVFFLTRFRCFLVKRDKAARAEREPAVPPLPMTPVIAQAAAQLRAISPPALAQADFGGFVQALAAKILSAQSLKGHWTQEQLMVSPALWNEMVHALYALQSPWNTHAALAHHFQSGEEARAQLLPAIGVVVYEALAAKE